MSSFYAGIMAGSAGGTTNYDQIVGAPVVNIGGDTGVTNLATLKTGHYNLKGAYTLATESSEEFTNSSNLDVLVLEDTVTSRHIVEFMTVDNGEVFFNVITYEEDGTLVDHNKISLTAPSHSSWGDII